MSPSHVRPRGWLLFMMTFTIPLRDQALVSLPGANVRVGDVFVVLGLGLLLWDVAVRRESIAAGAMDLAILTFLVYTLTSLIWALDPAFGAARVAKFLRNIIFYSVIAWELRGDFAFGFRALAYGAVASFSYLLGYLAFAVLTGKVSLVRLAAQNVAETTELNSWRNDALGSASFGGGTINALAMWSSVSLILWLGAAKSERHRRALVVFWGVCAALLAMTLATLSRGAWLALAVALVAWFALMRGRLHIHRWILIAIAIGTVTFAGAIVSTPLAKLLIARALSATTPTKDASIRERLYLWKAARELIRENPALGVGAGGTIVGIPAVSRYHKYFVHNMYLQLSAEYGMLGVSIWVSMMVFALLRIFLTRHQLALPERAVLFRMSSAMIALVSLCLTMGLTGLDFSELEWWLFMALTAALPFAASLRQGTESITEVGG